MVGWLIKMAEGILISRTFGQVRTALVADGVVREIFCEQADDAGLVGNIYLGKVVRIMSQMQVAFVDIGQSQMGFLHIDDIHHAKHAKTDQPKITQCIHQGERLLVQVTKDETHTKGARLTTGIALSSMHLVYRPYDKQQVQVSSRLAQDEKKRLRHALQAFVENNDLTGSVIVRTNAEAVDLAVLQMQTVQLKSRWQQITQKSSQAKLSRAEHMLIEAELPLALRNLREWVGKRTEWVVTDDGKLYESVLAYTQNMLNDTASIKVDFYQARTPLFEAHGIEFQLQEALKRQIKLPSGAYLVFDKTEALATIDVNTGAFTGKHCEQISIYQTNIEAVNEIARQIRLRNLGGMIVIDFIDMKDKKHQDAVLTALKSAIKTDRAKVYVVGMNELGLVTLTRHRTHDSLLQQLCEPCQVCDGSGYIKRVDTVAFEIIRKLLAKIGTHSELGVVANPLVVEYLQTKEQQTVHDLERLMGKTIYLRADSGYHLTQHDIVYC